MHADIEGALWQLNKSYRMFQHCGKSLTKSQVKTILEHGLKKGYKTTAEFKEGEVDKILSDLFETKNKFVYAIQVNFHDKEHQLDIKSFLERNKELFNLSSVDFEIDKVRVVTHIVTVYAGQSDYLVIENNKIKAYPESKFNERFNSKRNEDQASLDI
jgi:hypothetical protein